jgi:two-component system NtrC family sensor kinase
MNTPVGFVASNFQTLQKYMTKLLDLLHKYEALGDAVEDGLKEKRLEILDQIKQARKDLKIDFLLEDIGTLFEESNEGLSRVTKVIQNLKDFSRVDQAQAVAEYDLNGGIEATLTVARNEIKYDADVKTELSPLPEISCNSGQINQVLLNILVNAVQAIKSQTRDDRGTITVRTLATPTEVICEISDDGPGIAPEIRLKIFDPFFTTKPVGQGTGLGLSVSYDIIVTKHHGKIAVDSTVGKGTTFTITLPVVTPAAPPAGLVAGPHPGCGSTLQSLSAEPWSLTWKAGFWTATPRRWWDRMEPATAGSGTSATSPNPPSISPLRPEIRFDCHTRECYAGA